MQNNNLSLTIRFFVYILLQVIFFRNFALFDYAVAYPYAAFILLLPFEMTGVTTLLLAFGLGLSVDVFYDSLGIQAAACLLMAYMRRYLVRVMVTSSDMDAQLQPGIYDMGFRWFAIFASTLLFFHHFALFWIDMGGIENLPAMLLRAVVSTVFTLAVVVSMQYLFYAPKKYRQ